MCDEGRIDAFGLSEKSSVTSLLLDAPVHELELAYTKLTGRTLNHLKPVEVSLAVTYWLEERHPGKYVGGFWTGEESTISPNGNRFYRIVCIVAK